MGASVGNLRDVQEIRSEILDAWRLMPEEALAYAATLTPDAVLEAQQQASQTFLDRGGSLLDPEKAKRLAVDRVIASLASEAYAGADIEAFRTMAGLLSGHGKEQK